MEAIGEDVIGPSGQVFPISPGMLVGGMLLLSGQMPMLGGKIIGQTIEEQTDAAIDNIAALLAPLGKDLSHVVKITVWLTSAEDFAGFNAAYARRFAKPYPARSTLVSQLVIPGALVEIEAVAFIG
jgi:2-iminobutanoate/2-iminopropanoate deaminase